MCSTTMMVSLIHPSHVFEETVRSRLTVIEKTECHAATHETSMAEAAVELVAYHVLVHGEAFCSVPSHPPSLCETALESNSCLAVFATFRLQSNAGSRGMGLGSVSSIGCGNDLQLHGQYGVPSQKGTFIA